MATKLQVLILCRIRELPFETSITCEGCSMIEVKIPKDYHDKKNYSICLEMEEAGPVFEPIKG